MVNARKSFLIIYGSQTGQGESIAERIFSQTSEMNLEPKLFCMNEMNKEFNLHEEPLIIIVISSTGDGDPPDNAQKFMKKLHDKSLSEDFLSNIKFALLGLGDSNYSTFQGVPKKLENRLLQLGAKQFIESGGADDQIGLELVVEPWLDRLYSALQTHFNLRGEKYQTVISNTYSSEILTMSNSDKTETNNHVDEEENKLIPFFNIEPIKFPVKETSLIWGSDALRNQVNLRVPVLSQYFLCSSITHEHFNPNLCQWQNGERFPGMHSEPVEVKVVGAVEISSEGCAHKPKREIHLELGRDNVSMKLLEDYDAGDSFYFIFPNPKTEVEFILDRLKLLVVADQTCHLSIHPKTNKRNASLPKYIPHPCSLRYIFTYCLDIRRAPGRPLLRVLVEYTSNETEKRRLLELCSAEGVEEFTTYVRQAGISLVDLLIAFPSCTPPVDRLIELLPRLLPRPYSVSSFKNRWRQRLRFVYSLLRFPAGNGIQYSRFGVCSEWITTLKIGDKIQIIHKEPSKFRLPPISQPDLSIYDVPLVLIGPGTGIAPFMSFLHKLMDYDLNSHVKRYVFYGSFNLDEEFIFREELERLKKDNVITDLLLCESRVLNTTRPKYVQDALKLRAKEIANLLTSDNIPLPLIFACGDANGMSKDLWKCFQSILQDQLGYAEQDANLFLKKLKDEGRYIEDVWS